MYVDFEEVNNEHFSEPSSELRTMEQETNKRENDLIYGKIIEVLAQYIKDYKERAIKILAKHRVQTGTSDQEVVNAVVEMLYRGDKAFKDDLVSDMMETGILRGNEDEKSSSFDKDEDKSGNKKLTYAIIAVVIIVVLFFVFRKKK